MTEIDDPFDRAVRRLMPRRDWTLRVVLWSYVGFGLMWAVVLAAHWAFFAAPRWLAVAHTIVFALAVAYALASFFILAALRRRRPDWFKLDEL